MDFYWWEVIIFLRKFLFLVIGMFLSNFPQVQVVASVGVLLLALVAHIVLQPYEFKRANSLESGLLLALIAVLCCGLLFDSGRLPNESGLNELVLVFFLVLFVGLAALASYVVVKELSAQLHAIEPEHLDRLQQVFRRPFCAVVSSLVVISQKLPLSEAQHMAAAQALASANHTPKKPFDSSSSLF